MAKFLTGNELNSELEKLFERAYNQIILISPYIKIHDRFASTLRTKKDYPEIQLIIVFGKNEDDISRSMKEEDFNFFKEFPNIQIRYEKRLHAKYYANEDNAILTSMNLYNYSQDNNIEAGVMTKANVLSNLASNIMSIAGEDSFDNAAWQYFNRVIDQSELLFNKVPIYESVMLGLSKKYKSSKIEVDKLTDFFGNKQRKGTTVIQEVHDQVITKASESAGNHMEKLQKKSNPEILNDTKYFSTTALSKEVNISSKDLFRKLEQKNLIERKHNDWILTDLGKKHGGIMKNGQYGEYISWPSSIIHIIT
jgi:hypothetical protein